MPDTVVHGRPDRKVKLHIARLNSLAAVSPRGFRPFRLAPWRGEPAGPGDDQPRRSPRPTPRGYARPRPRSVRGTAAPARSTSAAPAGSARTRHAWVDRRAD